MKLKERNGIVRVLKMLPERLKNEISSLAYARSGGIGGIREIALRSVGRSYVTFADGVIPLFTAVGSDEIEKIVFELCDGALYAFRDTIREGYIPFSDGVRVGVAGVARYEEGEVVGITGFGSLLFRIPTGECAFREDIVSICDGGIGRGMLIYSPPGVGKTTALRVLAGHIGSGAFAKRVTVVDERREFIPEDYAGCRVDILVGYRRAEGIEIATRTMSPDVILTDELSGDDAVGVSGVLRSGVPLIASAHAADYSELTKKPSLIPILDSGVFSIAVGISRTGMGYSLKVDRF